MLESMTDDQVEETKNLLRDHHARQASQGQALQQKTLHEFLVEKPAVFNQLIATYHPVQRPAPSTSQSASVPGLVSLSQLQLSTPPQRRPASRFVTPTTPSGLMTSSQPRCSNGGSQAQGSRRTQTMPDYPLSPGLPGVDDLPTASDLSTFQFTVNTQTPSRIPRNANVAQFSPTHNQGPRLPPSLQIAPGAGPMWPHTAARQISRSP